jgi:hypothetical protein
VLDATKFFFVFVATIATKNGVSCNFLLKIGGHIETIGMGETEAADGRGLHAAAIASFALAGSCRPVLPLHSCREVGHCATIAACTQGMRGRHAAAPRTRGKAAAHGEGRGRQPALVGGERDGEGVREEMVTEGRLQEIGKS